MGGEIVVQSVYGSGSKFTIMLNQKIDYTPLPSSSENISSNVLFYDKKILVVDDNKLNLKVASKILRCYKPTVVLSESGFDAIDKVTKDKYDLILLDIMMPKMSGNETLKKLKEIKGFDTPVVALTADAVSGMREKYINEGFDDYLAKPINKKELENVLNKLLSKKINIHKSLFDPLDDLYQMDKKLSDIKVEQNINEDKELIDNKLSNNHILIDNGVDLDGALLLLGDIETYDETLNTFISEINSKISDLKKYKETKDMNNYSILIHSLKSDAKYLGFSHLAELALDHELMSKDGKQDYIDEHFKELNDEFDRVIKLSSDYFNK